jgi:L-threonylcarbamoyladenylate synthase
MAQILSSTNINVTKAAKSLKRGNLVAFPTETVYGIGADATNFNALSRLFSVKSRPHSHPLIVHIASLDQAKHWTTEIPNYALYLAENFWPGPMTLIFSNESLAGNLVNGGQASIALRIPSDPIASQLISEFTALGGHGIAAPSANKYKSVSPTQAQDVSDEIGPYLSHSDIILDGGKCSIGIESTIISCINSKPRILRPGAITAEMIKNCVGIDLQTGKQETKLRYPGIEKSHYRPKARVVLNKKAKPGEGFMALSHIDTPSGAIRLASPDSVEQFASQLYATLRLADKKLLDTICVILPPASGVGVAIIDRLLRSSYKNE